MLLSSNKNEVSLAKLHIVGFQDVAIILPLKVSLQKILEIKFVSQDFVFFSCHVRNAHFFEISR